MILKKGIDVSAAQGVIDWAAVKASGLVDFAIIRSGYGWTTDSLSRQRDNQFLANIKGCEDNGIPYGIYHYSYCVIPENARKEAQYCLKIIEGTNPEYGVWLDIEDPSQVPLGRQKLTQLALDWCDEIEKAGYPVGVYSYREFLNNYLDMPQLSKYDTWVAEIGDKTAYTGDYGIWQYSWKGFIPGIKGAVDLDYAYKDYTSEKDEYTQIKEELLKIKNIIETEMKKLDSIISKM